MFRLKEIGHVPALSIISKSLLPPPKLIYIYVCIYVYTYINLVARESSPWIAAAHGLQQPSWCSRGPPGSPGHRACRMHRWAVLSTRFLLLRGSVERSSPAWVKSLRGHLTSTRQSPHIRAFLQPGKSSHTRTCQSGGSHQWGKQVKTFTGWQPRATRKSNIPSLNIQWTKT